MDKKAQKADAWKKIQEEMKDRRTSKKKIVRCFTFS